MRKKQLPHLNTNSKNKKDLNQSRSQNNSSILNTQNSLSKIIKTEEDNLFNSNRNHIQITDKEMEDIEKKLNITNTPFSNSQERLGYVRENVVSNREIRLPKNLIQNHIEYNEKLQSTTSFQSNKETSSEVAKDTSLSTTERTPRFELSSTNKKVMIICLAVLLILAVLAIVFIYFKTAKK